MNQNIFVVSEYESLHIYDDREFIVQSIGIGVKSFSTNNIIPSPLTNFIKRRYRDKGKGISSQRNCAYAITRFLNYVYGQVILNDEDFIHLKEEGICGLNLTHSARYITYLSLRAKANEITPNYVHDQMKYLVYFYYWLAEDKIIHDLFELSYYTTGKGKNIKKVPRNPFLDNELDIILVGRDERVPNLLVDFGSRRYTLVEQIIKLAQIYEPDIVLGICFQFFGGLRRSEVVNLTKQSVDLKGNGTDGFILKVRDNQDKLFPHIKNSSHLQVKRPRDQALLVNNLLLTVYDEHIKRLKTLEQNGIIKNNYALFVSKHNGMPISGKQYHAKFMKIKSLLLKKISDQQDVETYTLLTDNSWSTHIGRGVFTNFLLDLGMNVTQVAIARGDRSIDSVLSYVDEKTAVENMKLAVEEIRSAYNKGSAQIDSKFLNNWSVSRK
ncbi:hypothetical protein [Bacillus sp. FJAT-29937]|uniref:hypothetical protein n=1 Tax=Bacillus sp. FJAT-29937 TaxID=1720553 RepID=UPI0008368A84|nr:hypothetical protein [Bacillus sp. FJAT-29937]